MAHSTTFKRVVIAEWHKVAAALVRDRRESERKDLVVARIALAWDGNVRRGVFSSWYTLVVKSRKFLAQVRAAAKRNAMALRWCDSLNGALKSRTFYTWQREVASVRRRPAELSLMEARLRASEARVSAVEQQADARVAELERELAELRAREAAMNIFADESTRMALDQVEKAEEARALAIRVAAEHRAEAAMAVALLEQGKIPAQPVGADRMHPTVPILATTAAHSVATLNHELIYLETLQDHEKDIISEVARARDEEITKLHRKEHYDAYTGQRIKHWNDDFQRKQDALYHAWDRIGHSEKKHHQSDTLLHTRSEASWTPSMASRQTVPTGPTPAVPVPAGHMVRTVVHGPSRESRAPSPEGQSRSSWDWLAEMGQQPSGATSVPFSSISVAHTGGTGSTVTPGKSKYSQYPISPRQSL